jgi:mRNA interferase RelE/StbE
MPDQIYTVELSPAAARELRGLAATVQRQLVKKLRALALNPRPRGVRKLAGEEGIYRIRAGDYRVLYQIRDAVLVVLVVHLGHRRDVYR